ncbi:MAG: thioredoxin-dependent thiol peroxidase [Actinobacteria bacterium]|jgi:peroxiredoxin Q/BCP|nr:thioredoxin-dependent thiol peroxidase [Actinomycetota bacterium]MCL6104582.1 thioredoxin-dependent thiol peroxidase [Actinomycetota bacterium]
MPTSKIHLQPGDKAPPFSLLNQDNQKVSLKDFNGQNLVIYFYPADDTPGCTTEACQFNDNLQAFGHLGVTVLGISPDDAVSHKRFREKYKLGLTLLSDANHEVMSLYGAWGTKTLYGKTTVGVIRSTFLIGTDGKIIRSWYGVHADGHAGKVLAALDNIK